MTDPASSRSQRQTKAQLAAALELAGARIRSLQVLLEWACRDRDRGYQRLSTCAAENTAYRGQRDEAVAALAELVEAVAAVQLSDLPHEEIVAAVGLPLPLGRRLVERYRRPVVPPDARETGASGTMAGSEPWRR